MIKVKTRKNGKDRSFPLHTAIHSEVIKSYIIIKTRLLAYLSSSSHSPDYQPQVLRVVIAKFSP